MERREQPRRWQTDLGLRAEAQEGMEGCKAGDGGGGPAGAPLLGHI